MNVGRYREFLAAGLEAANSAGAILKRHFGSSLAVERKVDGSPVSCADHEAQQAILDLLRRRFPAHVFVAEEGEQEGLGEFVWVVDPLDGTKNFLRGVPLFSVEVALLHEGRPILGISYMPALDSLLWGVVGEGAFLNGARVCVSSVDRLTGAALSLGGLKYFERSGYLGAASTLASTAEHVRCLGDAYAYHLVSSGRFDAVVEAHFSIWDVAACSAIVRAAGGMCTDFAGAPVGLATTRAVCSNGTIHAEILSVLADGRQSSEY